MRAEIKRLLANLGDLAALADQFEQVASIEQAKAETTRFLEAARAEAKAAKDEALTTRAKLADDVANAEERLRSAKAELVHIEDRLSAARAIVAAFQS